MKPERPLDSATVADCYRVYKDLLERYAWSVLRDWSLASDAVQNGFVALARFGGDVEPEARKAWLFKVVHREAIRIRNQENRQQRDSLDCQVVQESHAAYQLDPLGKMQQKETVVELGEQIELLPSEQRTVLRMRFFEDKTFAQIAKELNVPLGTALSRMRLALERLRDTKRDSQNEQ